MKLLLVEYSNKGGMLQTTHAIPLYSLCPKILVGEMNVSRHILVLDIFIFIHFSDKYFRTEGVLFWKI